MPVPFGSIVGMLGRLVKAPAVRAGKPSNPFPPAKLFRFCRYPDSLHLSIRRMMRRGAIILCGGQSTRMGQSKAHLPFGEETMLARMVRLLLDVVDQDRIVVVGAAGQSLPPLPQQVSIVRDEQAEQGPLEGLRGGVAALADRADAIYATSCDAPRLAPAFVERMFELLADHQIAVPAQGKYRHPLAAVYRPTILPKIETLMAGERRRPAFLFSCCDTLLVPVEELRQVDPDLATLENLNTQEDYQAALRAAGLAD